MPLDSFIMQRFYCKLRKIIIGSYFNLFMREVTKLHIVNAIHKYWGLLYWEHQKDQLFISTSILPYFARTVSTYLLKTTVSRTVQSILGASLILKQRLKISRFHKHLCCVRWKSCPKTIAPSVKPPTFLAFGVEVSAAQKSNLCILLGTVAETFSLKMLPKC